MEHETDAGFDYGLGAMNIDHLTGIRYGVIHHLELGEYWYDAAEADYGLPTCGYCGNEYEGVVPTDDDQWECGSCGKVSSEDEIYSDEPLAWTYTDGGYVMQQDGDSYDIFVIASPYYTLCSFCSPCAPGAGYIMSQNERGIRAYCPGLDWFEDDKAPYTIYRVSDDTVVYQPDLDVKE